MYLEAFMLCLMEIILYNNAQVRLWRIKESMTPLTNIYHSPYILQRWRCIQLAMYSKLRDGVCTFGSLQH